MTQTMKALLPRIPTPVLLLAVYSVATLILMLLTGADAQATTGGTPAAGTSLNEVLNPKATTVCNEVKSLTQSTWLKVFLLIGAGMAIVNIYRKQKDGWTNLGWVIVAAAIVGVIWQMLSVFGIGC